MAAARAVLLRLLLAAALLAAAEAEETGGGGGGGGAEAEAQQRWSAPEQEAQRRGWLPLGAPYQPGAGLPPHHRFVPAVNSQQEALLRTAPLQFLPPPPPPPVPRQQQQPQQPEEEEVQLLYVPVQTLQEHGRLPPPQPQPQPQQRPPDAQLFSRGQQPASPRLRQPELQPQQQQYLRPQQAGPAPQQQYVKPQQPAPQQPAPQRQQYQRPQQAAAGQPPVEGQQQYVRNAGQQSAEPNRQQYLRSQQAGTSRQQTDGRQQYSRSQQPVSGRQQADAQQQYVGSQLPGPRQQQTDVQQQYVKSQLAGSKQQQSDFQQQYVKPQQAVSRQQQQQQQQFLQTEQRQQAPRTRQEGAVQQREEARIRQQASSPTTTTAKPTPHQPPLSVFMDGAGSSSSGRHDVRLADVVAALRHAQTIAVLEEAGPDTPRVFVGPSTLEPPDGYAKFELPYLSALESNRVERKVVDERPPFFVAPLSFKPPQGYSKIPFPAPHVGSVVVANEVAPGREVAAGGEAKRQLSQGYSLPAELPPISPQLPALVNSLAQPQQQTQQQQQQQPPQSNVLLVPSIPLRSSGPGRQVVSTTIAPPLDEQPVFQQRGRLPSPDQSAGRFVQKSTTASPQLYRQTPQQQRPGPENQRVQSSEEAEYSDELEYEDEEDDVGKGNQYRQQQQAGQIRGQNEFSIAQASPSPAPQQPVTQPPTFASTPEPAAVSARIPYRQQQRTQLQGSQTDVDPAVNDGQLRQLTAQGHFPASAVTRQPLLSQPSTTVTAAPVVDFRQQYQTPRDQYIAQRGRQGQRTPQNAFQDSANDEFTVSTQQPLTQPRIQQQQFTQDAQQYQSVETYQSSAGSGPTPSTTARAAFASSPRSATQRGQSQAEEAPLYLVPQSDRHSSQISTTSRPVSSTGRSSSQRGRFQTNDFSRFVAPENEQFSVRGRAQEDSTTVNVQPQLQSLPPEDRQRYVPEDEGAAGLPRFPVVQTSTPSDGIRSNSPSTPDANIDSQYFVQNDQFATLRGQQVSGGRFPVESSSSQPQLVAQTVGDNSANSGLQQQQQLYEDVYNRQQQQQQGDVQQQPQYYSVNGGGLQSQQTYDIGGQGLQQSLLTQPQLQFAAEEPAITTTTSTTTTTTTTTTPAPTTAPSRRGQFRTRQRQNTATYNNGFGSTQQRESATTSTTTFAPRRTQSSRGRRPNHRGRNSYQATTTTTSTTTTTTEYPTYVSDVGSQQPQLDPYSSVSLSQQPASPSLVDPYQTQGASLAQELPQKQPQGGILNPLDFAPPQLQGGVQASQGSDAFYSTGRAGASPSPQPDVTAPSLLTNTNSYQPERQQYSTPRTESSGRNGNRGEEAGNFQQQRPSTSDSSSRRGGSNRNQRFRGRGSNRFQVQQGDYQESSRTSDTQRRTTTFRSVEPENVPTRAVASVTAGEERDTGARLQYRTSTEDIVIPTERPAFAYERGTGTSAVNPSAGSRLSEYQPAESFQGIEKQTYSQQDGQISAYQPQEQTPSSTLYSPSGYSTTEAAQATLQQQQQQQQQVAEQSQVQYDDVVRQQAVLLPSIEEPPAGQDQFPKYSTVHRARGRQQQQLDSFPLISYDDNSASAQPRQPPVYSDAAEGQYDPYGGSQFAREGPLQYDAPSTAEASSPSTTTTTTTSTTTTTTTTTTPAPPPPSDDDLRPTRVRSRGRGRTRARARPQTPPEPENYPSVFPVRTTPLTTYQPPVATRPPTTTTTTTPPPPPEADDEDYGFIRPIETIGQPYRGGAANQPLVSAGRAALYRDSDDSPRQRPRSRQPARGPVGAAGAARRQATTTAAPQPDRVYTVRPTKRPVQPVKITSVRGRIRRPTTPAPAHHLATTTEGATEAFEAPSWTASRRRLVAASATSPAPRFAAASSGGDAPAQRGHQQQHQQYLQEAPLSDAVDAPLDFQEHQHQLLDAAAFRPSAPDYSQPLASPGRGRTHFAQELEDGGAESQWAPSFPVNAVQQQHRQRVRRPLHADKAAAPEESHSREPGAEHHNRETGAEHHSREPSAEHHSHESSAESQGREPSIPPHRPEQNAEPHSREPSTESHSRVPSAEHHSHEPSTEPQSTEPPAQVTVGQTPTSSADLQARGSSGEAQAKAGSGEVVPGQHSSTTATQATPTGADITTEPTSTSTPLTSESTAATAASTHRRGNRRGAWVRVRARKRPQDIFETAESQNVATVANMITAVNEKSPSLNIILSSGELVTIAEPPDADIGHSPAVVVTEPSWYDEEKPLADGPAEAPAGGETLAPIYLWDTVDDSSLQAEGRMPTQNGVFPSEDLEYSAEKSEAEAASGEDITEHPATVLPPQSPTQPPVTDATELPLTTEAPVPTVSSAISAEESRKEDDAGDAETRVPSQPTDSTSETAPFEGATTEQYTTTESGGGNATGDGVLLSGLALTDHNLRGVPLEDFSAAQEQENEVQEAAAARQPAKVLRTSTKVSHETEICYRGRCIKMRTAEPQEQLVRR